MRANGDGEHSGTSSQKEKRGDGLHYVSVWLSFFLVVENKTLAFELQAPAGRQGQWGMHTGRHAPGRSLIWFLSDLTRGFRERTGQREWKGKGSFLLENEFENGSMDPEIGDPTRYSRAHMAMAVVDMKSWGDEATVNLRIWRKGQLRKTVMVGGTWPSSTHSAKKANNPKGLEVGKDWTQLLICRLKWGICWVIKSKPAGLEPSSSIRTPQFSQYIKSVASLVVRF